MNLTVGPLPPSVYWRRRLLVLAGVVLVVILFATMCSGSGKSDAASQRTAATTSPTPGSPSPSSQPQILGGGPAASSSASAAATGSPAAPPVNTTPTQSAECSDAEIKLTPTVQKNADGTWTLTLKVRNISTRTCTRDVGADPQEIHVVQNGQTVWSSDACQRVHGQPDVRTFPPNIEATFSIAWDGSTGTNCTNPTKISGSFQVVAKLASKVSDPVDYPPDVAK
jgi:hypothetical protein